ncbi:glycolate oxidase FAD binding subunit [Thiogranum longum]|uniref:Glycolate oxidase FAD binding subunit n=1 Tax=Thiogranum longum TaxID=1537524 RepID=A0A4R1HEX4_9GAMM|nr:glycolate oxidase subunit GlcE [Thiogranum longum]TCK17909.1 glycolate oxidase FAD binding subunit [Thiogranum longum]
MTNTDLTETFCEQIRDAEEKGTPLAITGGGSKMFYGRRPDINAISLDTTRHCGIISYEPSELVIQARSGTPLRDIETRLSDNNQMLAFEPPHFSENATLGGTIACGLSGPRRPYHGAARDFVLGTRVINGKGEPLHFGGQVMKNVAGYDVSRLMAGSLGTLGLIAEVSLKVLPRPACEYTLKQVCNQAEALRRFADWSGRPLPLSAACWYEDHLYLRLSGNEDGLRHAQHRLGDSLLESLPDWWDNLRDHKHPFFNRPDPLWRLSVPPATPPLAVKGDWFIDWGGAQRWLYSNDNPEQIRRLVTSIGGHATLFRNATERIEVFHPLPTPLLKLQQRIKRAMDPAGILNPGRLYPEL